MITNHKIEVGDVRHSRLSGDLHFTVSVNKETLKMMEDIAGTHNLTAKELAHELAALLETSIHTNYHRGGMRRKYD